MKIDIYTLLGMIKDNKAPKKIRYSSYVFKYTGDKRISRMYVMENQETYLFRDMVVTLTNEVEILETTITYKPDKIELLRIFDETDFFDYRLALNQTRRKINEIIDVINKEN